MEVLEAKASQYRQARHRRNSDLRRAALTISKTGHVLPDQPADEQAEQAADQALVTVTKANRQAYYQGFHVSLPSTFGGRQYYRTIIDDEFLLSDIDTGSTVFCTQYAKKDWHQRLGSGVHADAIMDRIVHNTLWIDTVTHNMREHAAANH